MTKIGLIVLLLAVACFFGGLSLGGTSFLSMLTDEPVVRLPLKMGGTANSSIKEVEPEKSLQVTLALEIQATKTMKKDNRDEMLYKIPVTYKITDEQGNDLLNESVQFENTRNFKLRLNNTVYFTFGSFTTPKSGKIKITATTYPDTTHQASFTNGELLLKEGSASSQVGGALSGLVLFIVSFPLGFVGFILLIIGLISGSKKEPVIPDDQPLM